MSSDIQGIIAIVLFAAFMFWIILRMPFKKLLIAAAVVCAGTFAYDLLDSYSTPHAHDPQGYGEAIGELVSYFIYGVALTAIITKGILAYLKSKGVSAKMRIAVMFSIVALVAGAATYYLLYDSGESGLEVLPGEELYNCKSGVTLLNSDPMLKSPECSGQM